VQGFRLVYVNNWAYLQQLSKIGFFTALKTQNTAVDAVFDGGWLDDN
jgi:hypothetical protein